MEIAGTGHRPNKLGGYNSPLQDRLLLLLIDWLNTYKPTKVYLGMAVGFDQILALACIKTNTPFVAAIPFKGQENYWPRSVQDHYHYILSKASDSVLICEGSYSAYKMQLRNEWMVDQLKKPEDKILACHDGSPGGTNNCIQYALEEQKTIENIFSLLKP